MGAYECDHTSFLDRSVNPVELKYCTFMISLGKCTWSCNVLSSKIYVPKETKDINVKVQHVIQIKNGIIMQVNVNVKIIISAKKIIVKILAHVFAKIAKALLILQWSNVLKLYLWWILYQQKLQIL